MNEQEYEEILNYLSMCKYPPSANSKDSRSNYRKKCRPFSFCKNELFYNHRKHGPVLVVKGTADRQRVIETCHLKQNGRHHGINRTLKKISTNYYWKTIARDVQNYVKLECQTCIEQVNKQKKALRQHVASLQEDSAGGVKVKPKEKIVDRAIEHIGLDEIGNILEPQETVSNVFKCETVDPQPTMQQPLVLRDHIMLQCGLDVIGPLSETHRGKRFIVVLTDCVTKWAEATALSEVTTEAVGTFLAEVMCRHGSIEEIMTKHNHNDFCTRLTEKLCSLMGITIRMSALLTPQTNGYVEQYWYNSLLCGALIKYCHQCQYYWDTTLHQVILAYRTFHQKNSLGSPFQLLYDRPTRLPVLNQSSSSSEGFPDEQETLIAHMITYIKAFSCPTHQQQPPLANHTQPGDRLTPSCITSDNLSSSALSSTPVATSQQQSHQPSANILGSFTPTVQSNNQITTSPLTSIGTNIQLTSQNNAMVYTIPANGVTAQTVSGTNIATQTITANSLNTQTIQNNNLNTATIPANTAAHSLQDNSITTHNIANNNHIITTLAATSGANQVAAGAHTVSVAQSSSVQTSTNLTTQTTSDAQSGQMVMIHTDGKAYEDSFYVICQPYPLQRSQGAITIQ